MLVIALLLDGCGFGAVEITPYQPEPGTSEACATLSEALPEIVADAVRRDTEPAVPYVAAWGDPAVVLRCGVPLPPEYGPDSQLLDVDGVGWLPVDGEGGTFFTAADRDVHIEVAVPDDYAPEADVLTDLTPAILDTIPERGRSTAAAKLRRLRLRDGDCSATEPTPAPGGGEQVLLGSQLW